MKNIISTIAISIMLVNFVSNAQDITNTLAPNGSFKIKDSSTDYFILNQSNGTITLPLQLAGNQRGSIFKGADRFLHTYHAFDSNGFNTFLGINAGNFTMFGVSSFSSYNTGVGYLSLSSLTTGSRNSAFGTYSLNSNTAGFDNSAFGSGSLYNNTDGLVNSAFGSASLYNNSTGNNNSAFGTNSLFSNTIGSYNSAFGESSLFSNTTGNSNSAFGTSSLASNATGNSNSAFGVSSLASNTSGYFNSAFGTASLYFNSTGNENSAFGFEALKDNLSGSFNSAFGRASLIFNQTGYENSAFGTSALFNNRTGWHNTAFGFDALRNNIAGFQNTAVGHHSLQNNTGNYNTAIGYNAGSNVTTGANLTLVGIDANPSSPTAFDQITLGNIFVSSLRCNVQTITSLSDARDKKNITDLTLGLDFITKLKPRQFNWDKRDWYEDNKSDGSKMNEEPTAGFIAQEFDEIQKSENAEWLNLVLKDNPDKWEATYGNLLPVMVKAIQELKIEKDEEVAKLNDEISFLKSKVESVSSIEVELTKIESLKQELIQQINELKSMRKEYENKFSSTEN